MNYKKTFLVPFLIGLLAILNAGAIKRPLAEQRPYTTFVHGRALVDNWSWLKNREDPSLPQVLKAEHKYRAQALKASQPLAKRLYKEFKANLWNTSESYPYLKDGYLYYTREVSGQAYLVHCRKRNIPGAGEEIILDENILARGKAFFQLGCFQISRCASYLAYSVDPAGDENYHLYIKNLLSGSTIDTGLDEISECLWLPDSQRLLLTKTNSRLQTDTAWYYNIADQSQELFFRENDPAFDLGIYESSSREMIFLTSNSKNSSEVWYLPLAKPVSQLQLLVPRYQGRQHYPDHFLGKFYIQSNLDDPDTQIFVCEEADSGMESWKLLVFGDGTTTISSFLICRDALVVKARDRGKLELWICSPDSGELRYKIPNPELSDYGFWYNDAPDEPYFYYTRENEILPLSIYRHDFVTQRDSLLHTYQPRQAFDPRQYKTALYWVKAEDGIEIPLRLVYAGNLDLSSPKPLLLSGYGAYGDCDDPYFSATNLSLLKRGVILATAHPRGGGELGQAWYDAGRMLNKMNTISDFIACVDFLIEEGFSSPERLAIYGGSAGGLLIGAVLNQTPHKIKAAWLDVPFVDVLSTMLDPSLPLTVQEYEEWGNPQEEKYFEAMLAYSPYDNVVSQAYPEVYISTGWWDSRVGYWEALKFAQKLRMHNQATSKIVFGLSDSQGHSGSSDRYQYLKEYADGIAYVLYQIGVW
ncbi:MAG: prolyl oligopeptidase family serine peptidase [Candidatus Cloacimonetes bacterium]|nr:prolyl oligopeptidase family serine peptidase [Candidatus Cloacimonadota bacterium]